MSSSVLSGWVSKRICEMCLRLHLFDVFALALVRCVCTCTCACLMCLHLCLRCVCACTVASYANEFFFIILDLGTTQEWLHIVWCILLGLFTQSNLNTGVYCFNRTNCHRCPSSIICSHLLVVCLQNYYIMTRISQGYSRKVMLNTTNDKNNYLMLKKVVWSLSQTTHWKPYPNLHI